MSKETLDLWRKHEAESVKSDSIVASCNCNTKTPEVKYHAKGCKYRLISERNMLLDALNGLMKLHNDFMDGDATYENAYHCFYKGHYKTWDHAKEVIASVKGDNSNE